MKRKYTRFITLLLAFAIVASIASATVVAKAVDLNKECSLYVNPGSSEYIDDINEANVVLDVYQIAQAQESSHDNYSFSFIGPYGGTELSDSPDSDEWNKKSQEVAAIALGGDAPVVSGASCESRIGGLSAGLYLVIAHGADLEEYITTVTDKEGNENIATIALSGSQTINFAPVLISLPTKNKNDDDIINSANPGDWIYDSEITLKPGMAERFGALEIINHLEGYIPGSPATFVYNIEAVHNGELVYSDVISMTFNSDGTQVTDPPLDGIPVGAEVTVTEVYTGACYELANSSSDSQTVVVTPEEVVSVEFVNTPTDSLIRGGGLTYHFAYDGVWSMETIPHE